jgi:hypothetical protein
VDLSKLNLLVVDFESFFDRKAGYDLKKLSMAEYIRDERFKVHGMGYQAQFIEGKGFGPLWFPGNCDQAWINEFDWKNTAVIAHNNKFDSTILAWKYSVKPALFICTQAMSRAILGNSVPSHSLRYLAEHFGLARKGEMKTDGLRDLTETQEAELADYCKRDVEICAQLFEIFRKDFPASQYEVMDWTIRAFIEPRLQINVPLIQEEHENEKKRREEFFVHTDKAQFSSNVKFAELLKSRDYEVPTKVSPRTGKRIPALALGDTEFLQLLESEDETLRTLCEARVAAKSTLKETRSAKFAKVGATGPWPFDVQFSGATQTHRFSGGSGAGGNPQNLTRGSVLRQCIEAPEGYQLLVADLANIELRIQSYLACEPKLIEMIESGKDIYCDFATRFYGRPVTKADKNERQFGKTSILGLGYNMGPDKFIKTVKVQTGQNIEIRESRKAVFLYRARYDRITAYWDYCQRVLAEIAAGKVGKLNGLNAVTYDKSGLTLPSGLKVRFTNLRQVGKDWVYDRYDKTKLVEAKIYGGKLFENICQALAGEILKEAVTRIESLGIKCYGSVHDEVLALVPEHEADDALWAVESAMSQSPVWWPKIKLAAEVHYAKNWLEAK